MKFEQYLINEDARTEHLETAALLGAVCNASIMKNINKILIDYKNVKEELITKTFEDLKSYLSKDYDWSKQGISEIKKIKKKEIEKIIEVFALAKGMNNFVNDIAKKNLGNDIKFIHARINDYYKVEKEVLGEIPGSKANTADCILSNSTPDKIFDSMRNGNIKPDSKQEYIELSGKVKIIQVSLKKSETGAQLGKITSFLKKNLNYGEDDVTVTAQRLVQSEEFDAEKMLLELDMIDEGLWDKVKTIASDIWDKIKSATSKVLGLFTSKWLKVFKGKPSDAYLNDFFSSISLTEGVMNKNTEEIVKTLSKKPEQAVKIVNNEIKRLKNEVHGDNTIYLLVNELPILKKFKGNPTKAVFTIVSNYLTIRTLLDMVKDGRKTSEVVNRLVAEMFFGGTKLPLWKVYGDFGGEKSYVYLGTIDTFMKKQKPKPKIEILGIRITPQTDYYSIAVFFLSELSNEGKKYITLRTGTNSSSRFTFIFEGTSIRGPFDLNTPMSKIVDPRGK